MNTVEEALLSEHAAANDFVHSFDHPAVGPTMLPQAPLHFSRDHYTAADTSPAFGEHLREVLGELGYEDEEIDGLIERQAIAEELP